MSLAPRLREAIVDILSEAQSESGDVQHKALKTLASITKFNPQNRSLLARADGAISTLLILTRSSSRIVQPLSLSVLLNLSLNPDLKQSLATMETIYRLNSIIQSRSCQESAVLASSLICSLAILDKNKAKFGVAGTVQLLVKAIAEPSDPAAHHLLTSLAELVQFHGNCTLAVRSGAISVLTQLIGTTESEDLVGTSLTVLGLLARFDEGLIALTKTDGIVNSMVDVLKRRSMFSKEGAADILLRLFDESEGCVRDALRLPEFSTVLADLSIRGSTRARERASQLMTKMMEANLDPYMDGSTIYYQW